MSPTRLFGIGAAVIVALILVVGVVAVGGGYFDRETINTVVFDKERVCDSDGNGGIDCTYLIFTENGTFAISDALVGHVRFNSSDVYGRVRPCHNYEITSYGWRLPALSTYPNITEIRDLGKAENC
jgi:hypothetical protein